MVRVEPLTRILVPLDLSKVSDALVDFSSRLALKYDSEILLVHVIEEGVIEHVAAGYDVSGWVKELEEKAREKLSRYAEAVRERGVRVRVYGEIPVGDPAAVIAHIAGEENVSEILVASKGWGIKRIIPIGSTARLLAGISPVPLVRLKAVRREGRIEVLGDPDTLYSNILLAVDRDYSDNVVEYVGKVASRSGGTVTVLHVVEGDYDIGFIDSIVERLKNMDVGVSRMVLSGKPYKRIIEVSSHIDASLVAIERKVEDHPVLREILFGSVMSNLLGKLEKPLCIIPGVAPSSVGS